jgi:peptide/nickel transport system ATP-binding protein
MAALLEVKDLKTYFYRAEGVVKAVDGVSFSVNQGESLGIVGESGSGKSVSVMSLLRLIRKNGKVEGGTALFDGRDLLTLSKEEMRQVRGKDISLVFQDPMSSLNPTMRIGTQIMEPPLWHRLFKHDAAKARSIDLLGKVGIPSADSRFNDYPHQFSGGMRQRVMIATALTCSPKLIIADEPTTALDVTVRSQILNLMQDMKEESGTSVIMITHDFTVACNFCDRIIVMYAGRVMESAATSEFVRNARHPYSTGLLGSVLDIGSDKMSLKPIPGSPPNLIAPPPGCRFHPRCEKCAPRCRSEEPELREIVPGHLAACHFA